MTLPAGELEELVPDPEPPLPAYPDNTVGLLMRQRDELQKSADADRVTASIMSDRAAATETRVAQLDESITALGGESV